MNIQKAKREMTGVRGEAEGAAKQGWKTTGRLTSGRDSSHLNCSCGWS